jgi:NADP-dependent 3-hydroxy acid dehydrogenase YdfG
MSLNQKIDSFFDKKIWIIGASSGIGQATAHTFLKLGAKVALSSRRIASLEEIRAGYPVENSLVVGCDVLDEASLQNAYKSIKDTWGELDLLLYVAGVYEPLRADEFSLDKAKNIIATNVIGPMSACSVVLPDLIRQKHGGIGIVGSVAGYSGLPKALAYGPSKAAMINFCENLYYDLAPLGINVYMINPGFVATEATAKNDFHMPALISSDTAAKNIIDGISAGDFDIHFPKQFSLFLKFLRLLPYPIYFFLLKKFVKI